MTAGPAPAGTPAGRSWLSDWLRATGAVTAIVTVVDAALMQRKLSFFTGGFLADDHIASLTQAAAFAAASLLADVAAAGVIVAIALWLCGRVRMGRGRALLIALAAGLGPPAAITFVEYELRQYLGDAFDLALMFDLTGRSPKEMLAVSWDHLLWFGTVTAVAAAAIVLVVLMLRRRSRQSSANLAPVSLRRALAPAALVLAVGLAGTTALRLSSGVVDTGMKWKPFGWLLGVVVQKASDLDRDGAGLLSRPSDPAPFDSRIRPYAPDVPGNGVDEDGVGGDLPHDAAAAYAEPPLSSGQWSSTPDVVLVILESVRADVLGQTFRGVPVTPVLNALAARGISADWAYSHNGFTVQSRRHLFSGSVADVRGSQTLLDDFRAHGYQAAYFSAQDESFGGVEFEVGFERADVAFDARKDKDRRSSTFASPGSLAVPWDVVLGRVATFLTGRRTEKPLFLVLNLHDTHFPYYHGGIRPLLNGVVLPRFEIAPSRGDELRAMYQNTMRNVDDAIGSVLRMVQTSTGREPGVIVLSDHGESLYDEGFLGHGYALNDVQTRIPLIVANLPVTIEEPFAQADLRGAILAGLSGRAAEGQRPRLERNAAKGVFQYLGFIDQPAQIAFTGFDGQVAYDFRRGKARVNGSVWRRPEDLTADESHRWLELIRLWERMVIARARAREASLPR